MSDFIPLAVPNLAGREWDYVRDCLDTGWVSSVGAYVGRFEEELASAVEADYAVAVTTGTAALHLGLVLNDVQPDEEVLVPSLTFIATANAVRYTGAFPTFLDCEPTHLQLTAEILRGFLEDRCDPGPVHRETGRRVRGVIPVHVLGHPCDTDAIRAVADEYGLFVLEDAAEALGSRLHGRPVGSRSRTAVFSFNGNKILTTGGGGMIVTNDSAVADRARYLSTQAKDDPLRYVHGEVGYNYRLTNVQAAMGCAQLECLSDFVSAKRKIAQRYNQAFAGVPGLRVPEEADWAASNWWMYTVFLDRPDDHLSVDGMIGALRAQGIESRPLWQPLHRSEAFPGTAQQPCPVAEAAQESGISLPCSTSLSKADQTRVIAAVRRALNEFGRP